jgi:hypothetical protein
MLRLIVLAFSLALVSTAEAKPLAPLQPDDMVVTVREGCGVGYQRVGSRCVRNTAVRAFRRCAAGYRLVGARCIKR